MIGKKLYDEWVKNKSTENIANLFSQPVDKYELVIEDADIIDFDCQDKDFSITFNKNSSSFTIFVRALKGTDITGLKNGVHTICINNLVDRLNLILTSKNNYSKSIVFISGIIIELSSNSQVTIKY